MRNRDKSSHDNTLFLRVSLAAGLQDDKAVATRKSDRNQPPYFIHFSSAGHM